MSHRYGLCSGLYFIMIVTVVIIIFYSNINILKKERVHARKKERREMCVYRTTAKRVYRNNYFSLLLFFLLPLLPYNRHLFTHSFNRTMYFALFFTFWQSKWLQGNFFSVFDRYPNFLLYKCVGGGVIFISH